MQKLVNDPKLWTVAHLITKQVWFCKQTGASVGENRKGGGQKCPPERMWWSLLLHTWLFSLLPFVSLSVKSISRTNPHLRLHPSGYQQVHVWIMTEWIKMDNNLQHARRSLLHNVWDTFFLPLGYFQTRATTLSVPILSAVLGPSSPHAGERADESARQKTAADSEFKWIRPTCDRYWKWISPPVKTNNAFPAQRFTERRPGGGLRWMEDSAELPVTRSLLPWPLNFSSAPNAYSSRTGHCAHTHMQTHTLTRTHEAVNIFKGTEWQIKAFSFFSGVCDQLTWVTWPLTWTRDQPHALVLQDLEAIGKRIQSG